MWVQFQIFETGQDGGYSSVGSGVFELGGNFQQGWVSQSLCRGSSLAEVDSGMVEKTKNWTQMLLEGIDPAWENKKRCQWKQTGTGSQQRGKQEANQERIPSSPSSLKAPPHCPIPPVGRTYQGGKQEYGLQNPECQHLSVGWKDRLEARNTLASKLALWCSEWAHLVPPGTWTWNWDVYSLVRLQSSSGGMSVPCWETEDFLPCTTLRFALWSPVGRGEVPGWTPAVICQTTLSIGPSVLWEVPNWPPKQVMLNLVSKRTGFVFRCKGNLIMIGRPSWSHDCTTGVYLLTIACLHW